MASMTARRWLIAGLIAVLAALAIVSFVLPYIGHGHSGLTKLFP
jgi:uncharacterized membrane protein